MRLGGYYELDKFYFDYHIGNHINSLRINVQEYGDGINCPEGNAGL